MNAMTDIGFLEKEIAEIKEDMANGHHRNGDPVKKDVCEEMIASRQKVIAIMHKDHGLHPRAREDIDALITGMREIEDGWCNLLRINTHGGVSEESVGVSFSDDFLSFVEGIIVNTTGMRGARRIDRFDFEADGSLECRWIPRRNEGIYNACKVRVGTRYPITMTFIAYCETESHFDFSHVESIDAAIELLAEYSERFSFLRDVTFRDLACIRFKSR